MTEKAHTRAAVLLEVEAGRLSAEEAAAALEISTRYVRALRARLRTGGPTALNHGNIGAVPWNALCVEEKQRMVMLKRTPRYERMNDHQFTEYLAAHEGIVASRPTVYRTLRAAAIPASRSKRRRKAYHGRRLRSANAGHMVQMDASKHRWVHHLPKFTIVAGIDDATGYLWLAIRTEEDAQGYMEVLREITATAGVPRVLYTDRHTMFGGKNGYGKQQKHYKTQLLRVFRQLSIRLIRAKCAEAKGRVERVFDTLQDRLVAHFAFDQVQTMDDVERSLRIYLRNHNKRFIRAPREEQAAWRIWPSRLQPDDVFCFAHTRVVRNDNTISFKNQIIDLPPGPHHASRAKHHVDVLQGFDGTLRVMDAGVLVAVVLPARTRPRRRQAQLARGSTAERIQEL